MFTSWIWSSMMLTLMTAGLGVPEKATGPNAASSRSSDSPLSAPAMHDLLESAEILEAELDGAY